jgi:hypothetical protein
MDHEMEKTVKMYNWQPADTLERSHCAALPAARNDSGRAAMPVLFAYADSFGVD